MIVGVLAGGAAGFALNSRWAILVAPLLFAAAPRLDVPVWPRMRRRCTG